MQCNIFIVSVIVSFFMTEAFAYNVRHTREVTPDDDDECQKPIAGMTPGQGPPECCKMVYLFQLTGFSTCHAKIMPRGSRPTGSSSTTTSKPHGENFECFWECLFNSSGLLDKDRKLSKEGITKMISNVSATHPDWSSPMTAGAARCFENSANSTDLPSTCKSGAYDFNNCLVRQLFLNCPRSSWSSSDLCSEIKAKFEKCPHISLPSAKGSQRTTTPAP